MVPSSKRNVMPKFSKSSKKKLATCKMPLIELFEEVVLHWDCTIVCGWRNQEDQDRAYNDGFSKVRFPYSKHNILLSNAVDVAPYPINWHDIEGFKHFGFFVLGVAAVKNIPVRWGADWDRDYLLSDEKFIDLPHWELVI